MDGACSMYKERRGVYRDLWKKLERNRSLGRPKNRWRILKSILKKSVDSWIGLIWLRTGIGGGLL
jgi:transposase